MGMTRINRRKKSNKKSRKNKIGGTRKIENWGDNVTFGKPPEGSSVFKGFDEATQERNKKEFREQKKEKEKKEKKEKGKNRSPKRSPRHASPKMIKD